MPLYQNKFREVSILAKICRKSRVTFRLVLFSFLLQKTLHILSLYITFMKPVWSLENSLKKNRKQENLKAASYA